MALADAWAAGVASLAAARTKAGQALGSFRAGKFDPTVAENAAVLMLLGALGWVLWLRQRRRLQRAAEQEADGSG